ncbi:MAG TPA: MBL fold metallo-hydrolase [Candidatus Scatomorpha gallistercoris]|nr:MBL fold metallo-hydrolase [Candidatus Scatomorpha gallistercoris]
MAARKRRRGAPKSALGTLLAILAAALIAGGAQLGWFDNVRLTPAATPLPGEGVYVTFIDVGQGDSTLAYCEGETLLIDAGVPGQGEVVASYLDSIGVTQLDYVVCTHAHEDHCGGLDYILENYEVGMLFAPYTEFDSSGTFTRFEDTAAELGLAITVPEPGSEFTLGSAVFEFIGPVDDWDGDVNDSSLVVRLDYGDDSFLFTGDIGAEPLLDCAYVGGYSLNCDVLKLGHHGSSTSTDEEVLRLTSPEVAVASCGLDNSYGHPHDEVVELCDERGILLLRTDRDGDITLHSDGAEIIRAA